jgi:hypothetical protein
VAGVPSSSRGGGGGDPAGDDGEIQYNDAGAFGATPHLVSEPSGGNLILRLGSTANGTAQLLGNAPGVQLAITAAAGDETHVGGEVSVRAGNSAGQDGGEVNIAAGADSADGDGGSVVIASGSSVGADGGDVTIAANPDGTAGGEGGQIVISAGAGTDLGGSVLVLAGPPDGAVSLASGDNLHGLTIDSAGVRVGTTKLAFYSGTPAVQPTGVAVTAEAIHAALVTLGLITA